MAKQTWMAAVACLGIGLLAPGCGKEETPSANKSAGTASPAKMSKADQTPAPAAKTHASAAAEQPKPMTKAKTGAPPAPAAPEPAPKAAAQPAPESPLAKAKVGQWALYETMGGAKMKQTVTKVTAEAVTMKHEIYVRGQDAPVNTNETEIPLKGQAGAPTGQAPETKMKDLGKEAIAVAGKKLTCRVMQMTTQGVVVKTWTSPDVPINGLVKTAMTRDGKENVTMKLLDFGQK